jgi:hypothetical protein
MIWYVHRNGGATSPISWAGPQQDGYADEALDDVNSSELQAFLNPVVPTVQPVPRTWLERLPAGKQAAITEAAISNAAILLWLLKAAGSTSIDVTSEETIAGVGALVTAGIITSDDQALLLAP